jgi:hypothetical protein
MQLRRTLIALLMSIACKSLFAQTEFGFSAGINFSNARRVFDEKGHTHSYLTRLSVGADVAHYFDENWGVQSGLYYNGKGWRERYSLNYDTVVVRLNYLELPLKISYRFSESSEKTITVGGGVYAAYGLSGKTTFRNSPELTYDPFKEESYKRFDFGYIIEGGYRINNNYGVKISFSNGLLALRRPDAEMKNFLFNFSFCFVLNGKNNP